MADDRKRVFWFVIYPPEAVWDGKRLDEYDRKPDTPLDWLDRLRGLHLPIFVSPLHDMDPNLDPDSQHFYKKPHRHVILMFEGKKSAEQVAKIRAMVGGVPYLDKDLNEVEIFSLTGAARYLCHLDDADKYLYDTNDVIELGGADYVSTIKKVGETDRLIKEMTTFIRINHLDSFIVFFEYCKQKNPRWFHALVNSCTFVIKEYIWSLRTDRRLGIGLTDLADDETFGYLFQDSDN